MIRSLYRRASIYGAIAATVPKVFLTYRAWFWVGIILNVISMMIFVYFWRAVYANTDTIAGLNLQQTMNYILLAQVLAPPLTDTFLLFEFGYNIREGGMAIVLLRPVNLQGSYYVQAFANMATQLVWQIPMAVIATVFFGLRWPTEPGIWGAFIVSVILGRTALFFFDWILASLTFYTTEIWGLGVLLLGTTLFFSGGLVPLVMMPAWLQTLANSLPFAQTLYVPLSVLSGIAPLSQVPRLWLGQAVWIGVLAVLSHLMFQRAVRKVTVHGG